LTEWADRLGNPQIGALKLRADACMIAESLHLQRYKYLWDILFTQHPRGQWYEGKWQGMGEKKTDIPSYDLMVEMFTEKPTILIFDEFQTWYDGLTNTRQYPWRNWAFNFIQILSEIAQKNPELLVLVVSVREGNSDSYQQMHRINPVVVDFKGPLAKRDRQRLLLYRIFDNRMQIPTIQITSLIHTHVSECFRLAKVPQQEQDKRQEEFLEAWPFAPHLLKLLDDQVLIATDAQETRDLIKILVDLYKNHNPSHPIITAADFSLANEKSGVASLLDSVANQLHKDLREKALRNLEAVRDAVPMATTAVPHCEEIISALWLRSLTVDRLAGAEPAELQIDITRSKPIDDNQFEAELSTIVDNSFNIHPVGGRLVFKHEENARSKLLAHAKNDKLFQHGEDIDHLAKEIRAVIGGPEEVSQKFRVVVLKRKWESDPWSEFDEKEVVGRSFVYRCRTDVSRHARSFPWYLAQAPSPGGPQHDPVPVAPEGHRGYLLRAGIARAGQGRLSGDAMAKDREGLRRSGKDVPTRRPLAQAQRSLRPFCHPERVELRRPCQVSLCRREARRPG
jgi:hypothetical protein